MTRPNSAKHKRNEDGTVSVTYGLNGEELETVIYGDSREASIESSLKLFPGTSREWLERVHAKDSKRHRR